MEKVIWKWSFSTVPGTKSFKAPISMNIISVGIDPSDDNMVSVWGSFNNVNRVLSVAVEEERHLKFVYTGDPFEVREGYDLDFYGTVIIDGAVIHIFEESIKF